MVTPEGTDITYYLFVFDTQKSMRIDGLLLNLLVS
jgi:hypothetical protein